MNRVINYYRLWSVYLLFLLMLSPPLLLAQAREYIAMIPLFHDRQNTAGAEGPLQLNNQRFVVFVYKNAVAVYSETDFVNTSMETHIQEFALPSTGHEENGMLPGDEISTGILSVHLWVQGERIAPELINTGNEEWYTIKAQFAPGEQRKVKALFWAQTSLTDVDSMPGIDTVVITDGNRGFMFDFAHAAIWNGPIETVSINVVLLQGLDVKQGSFNIDPRTYEIQDSTLTWRLYNVELSASNNIFVWYSSDGKQESKHNSMATLSTYIVKTVYDNLRDYARKMDEE
jgi:hypothetical protein